MATSSKNANCGTFAGTRMIPCKATRPTIRFMEKNRISYVALDHAKYQQKYTTCLHILSNFTNISVYIAGLVINCSVCGYFVYPVLWFL